MRVLGLNVERFLLRRAFFALLMFASLIVMDVASVRAVLFKSTADPGYNTNAPSGTLTNSGWQYEGTWGAYLGTPIAPRFFITAKHIDGTTNQVFTLNGVKYHPIAKFTTIDSDLNVWQIAETFPIYAPLYTLSSESNNHVLVVGRGTDRGDPVVVGGLTNGWQWGSTNFVQRWGENDVGAITNGGSGVGELLRCTFDGGAGSNECSFSLGDSSGGLFIQDGSVWKLAGINYEVDGPFSTDGTTNTEFSAAMVDERGLYLEISPGVWQLQNGPQQIPSGFYATRISANLNWIYSVINFTTGVDLQIAGAQRVGNDVQVSFGTITNRSYLVQSSGILAGGVWTTFTNNIPGTGGIVSVLDINAASSTGRFYRVGFAH